MPNSSVLRWLTVLAVSWLSIDGAAMAAVVEKHTKIGATKVDYKVILPDRFDASKAYPGVLAFPGGPQTMQMVDGMIDRNLREQAEKRGYIVVVPAAPNGVLFFEGSEKIFPEFLKQMLADYKIQGGKLHMAGISNGGISAFHVAAMNPQYFLSITGLPGYLIEPSAERLAAISKMCIDMHVGELDSGWRQEMTTQSHMLQGKGMKVRFTVEKGQEHRLNTFTGAGESRLFDEFDEAQQGCGK